MLTRPSTLVWWQRWSDLIWSSSEPGGGSAVGLGGPTPSDRRDGLVEHLTRVNEQESVMFAQALCGRTFLESMVRQAAETGVWIRHGRTGG